MKPTTTLLLVVICTAVAYGGLAAYFYRDAKEMPTPIQYLATVWWCVAVFWVVGMTTCSALQAWFFNK